MGYIRVFFLLLFLGIVPFGCCDGPKQYYELIEKVNLQPFNQKKDSTIPSIDGDTLILDVSIETSINFVLNNSGFYSSAYALQQCPFDETLGLKNKIDSIIVYSDKTFNGIDPYRSLNNITFLKYANTLYYGTKTTSYSELKDNLNLRGSATSNFLIYLIKKPSDTLNQRFKVIIYTSGNGKFEKETLPLNWK